jgi:S-adenosylmethionine synthetase
MVVKLKAGNLSLANIPNDPLFYPSMALDIENELNTLMMADGLPKLSTDVSDQSVRDRRRLFVAIARGVVKHLVDHKQAFVIGINTPATVIMQDINTE